MKVESGIEKRIYKGIEITHYFSPSNAGFGWWQFEYKGKIYRPGHWGYAKKTINRLLKEQA